MSQFKIPSFLENSFRIHKYRTVEIDNLFVGLLAMQGAGISYVKIYDTPHYIFAKHVISGEPIEANHGYRSYDHYASINQSARTEKEFIKLIESISEISYDHKKRPVLVFRTWRRMYPLNRWEVADGFHRLAILAALGHERLTVATLRPKYTVVKRISGRLKGKHGMS